MRIGTVLCILLFSSAVLYGSHQPKKLAELASRSHEILNSRRNFLSVDQIDTASPMYAASVFMTIHVPFEPAAKAILDFEHWERIFKNITLMTRIPDTTGADNGSVIYYAEAKYAMIRGWGIGALDTVIYKPNRSVCVRVKPASTKLVNSYARSRNDEFRYNVKRLHIEGNLIRISDTECRIGIFAWSGTNRPIPLWLTDTLMKIVMPTFVGDFEKYVIKQEQRKKAAHKKAEQSKLNH